MHVYRQNSITDYISVPHADNHVIAQALTRLPTCAVSRHFADLQYTYVHMYCRCTHDIGYIMIPCTNSIHVALIYPGLFLPPYCRSQQICSRLLSSWAAISITCSELKYKACKDRTAGRPFTVQAACTHVISYHN